MTIYYSQRYATMHGHTCRKTAEKHRAIKEKTYFGSLCKKCDTNLRHSADRSCVVCSTVADTHTNSGTLSPSKCRAIANNAAGVPVDSMAVDRAIRKAAKLIDMEIYVGMKCDKCGGSYRYTNRGRCMGCVDARNKQYHLTKQVTKKRGGSRLGRPPKPKTAPARTGAAVDDEFDWLFD